MKVLQPPSYVPLVTRMVAVIDWLPEDEQVAPVMPPPPLLLVEDELVELELVELELVLLLDVELLLELDDRCRHTSNNAGCRRWSTGTEKPNR